MPVAAQKLIPPDIQAPTPPAIGPIDLNSLTEARIQERFSTYQRFFGFVSGWDTNGVRIAIDAHDSGSFGLSDLLKVVTTRFFGVDGPLEQRTAPGSGMHTEVTGGDRGIARIAREEFAEIVDLRVRPWFADIFEDHAMLGVRFLHHPWVRNDDGMMVPEVQPWPTLAVRYNWLYQRYEAYTAERGLVPIEGPTWTMIGNGRLPHLRGAIRKVADPWAQARYGERDEAALSAYLGRKVPIAILPKGIEPKEGPGLDIGDAVKTVGMARSAAIFPYDTKVTSLDNIDAGAAALFAGLMSRRLSALRIAILGHDATGQTTPGVYLSPEYPNLSRHVIRRDFANAGRAITRLGHLYALINYPQLRGVPASQLPGFRWLMPDPEEQERLDNEGKRATSYGAIVKGWHDAGLDPDEQHLDELARKLRTIYVPLGEAPPPPQEPAENAPGAGASAPAPPAPASPTSGQAAAPTA